MSIITKAIRCLACGGELENAGGDTYKCKHCGKVFTETPENKIVPTFIGILDGGMDYTNIANGKLNLWNVMHQRFRYPEECDFYARCLKEFDPSNYLANFTETACMKSDEEISAFLDSSSGKDMEMYAEAVLDFLEKLGHPSTYPSALEYLSRAFKKDSPEYENYAEKFNVAKVSESPENVKVSRENRKFWKVFKSVLQEHGNPFDVDVAAKKSKNGPYSVINNKKKEKDVYVGMDFDAEGRNIRIILYFQAIYMDSYILYERVCDHKDGVDRMLNYDAVWCETEAYDLCSRHLETTLSFKSCNEASYRDVTERAFPVLDRYLKVLENIKNGPFGEAIGNFVTMDGKL